MGLYHVLPWGRCIITFDCIITEIAYTRMSRSIISAKHTAHIMISSVYSQFLRAAKLNYVSMYEEFIEVM